jgi:chromosome segregation ATPase
MPCDTRLITFNEMLRLATEQLLASEKRSAECRTQLEAARADVQAAQERLDRAIFEEGKAREARETLSNFQRKLDEATDAFTVAQAAQRKIAEERTLITREIAKLSPKPVNHAHKGTSPSDFR